MIRTIVLTNPGGETLALDLFEPWKTGIAIKNIDGLGPGKADINTTDLALTDSALFNGSRVPKRTISLTLVPMATTTHDVAQSESPCMPTTVRCIPTGMSSHQSPTSGPI